MVLFEKIVPRVRPKRILAYIQGQCIEFVVGSEK